MARLPDIIPLPPEPFPSPEAPLPVPSPWVSDPIWLSQAKPKGQRIYVSMQGDWWDMIAIRVYGAKRGNEHLMFHLLEANYALRDVVNFSAGIAVVVPNVSTATVIPLVPWTSATILPNAQ